jgi:hypothetical protein
MLSSARRVDHPTTSPGTPETRSPVHLGGGDAVRRLEPRGPFSVAGLTGPVARFRSGEPFGPVGPLRPVEQAVTASGLTIPVPPGAFRPQGDQSERPCLAGVYDALLGGTAHRRVDRRFALAILLAWPDAPAAVLATRQFLVRAVQFAARNGMSQFLVVGGGTRSVDPVHEVARAVAPDSQTVYVEPRESGFAHGLPEVLRGEATVVLADPPPDPPRCSATLACSTGSTSPGHWL